MIVDFKTNEELDNVVKLNKPEKVLRLYFEKNVQYNQYQDFLSGLEDKYKELYPDTKVNEYGSIINIEYLEYKDMNIIKDEFTNEEKVIYVYDDSAYIFEEDENGVSIKTDKLTEEAQKLVDSNLIRPTLELFKKQQVEEFLKTIPTLEDDEVKVKYIEFIKPILNKQINNKYQESMDTVKASYPEAEQQTWFQQYQEATAYKNDNTVIGTLIKSISDSRGIDIGELSNRIITKYDSYSMLVGTATGLRQQAEDYIETIDSLDKINEFNSKFKEYSTTFKELIKKAQEG